MPKSFFRRITKKFVITVNVIVAVLFVLGCHGGLFNPQHWWPLGFLTLGAFYIFLLLLAFALFWCFVQAKWALITLVAVLVCYGPVTNIIPLRFSSSFKKEKDSNSLRVMSWNVEHFTIIEHKDHPEKKQEMIDLIRDYAPDVAVFQEMVGSETPGAINYLPEMLAQTGFSSYNYSYNPKLNFDAQHHFGIITLSKYPIINKQTVSYYPYDYNSIFQYTDIVKGEDTIRVFNIHLQSLKFSSSNLKFIDNPEMSAEKDVKASKNLLYKLKIGFLKRKTQSDRIQSAIAASPYPVVVAGDFNDVPNSYAYTTIGKGLQNAFAVKGRRDREKFSGISFTLRIDNIFASQGFTVQQYNRVDKKLSDHFPVMADLELGK